MKKRIITGLLMAIVGLPLLYFGGIYFGIGLAILSYLASYELLKVHFSNVSIPKVFLYVLPLFSVSFVVISCLHELGVNVTIETYFVNFIVIFLGLFCLAVLSKVYKVQDAIFTLFTTLYVGVSFSLMTLIRTIELPIMTNYLGFFDQFAPAGFFLFTFMLLSTMLTDMGAYTVGSICGKHKMCPLISPHKTWEGAIGGTLCGMLVGGTFLLIIAQNTTYLMDIFFDNQLGEMILFCYGISLLISVVSQFGDLVASLIKREYGVKDYGNIFPGHGGVMDRFDSLIFSTFFFTIILVAMEIL
jgi:phosphatidate cytidylyltransferase